MPKGVAVPHLAVTRLVMNTDYVNLTPSDRVAHIANITFDATTFEIWGALLHGARLVIIEKDTVLAPEDLATRLDQHGVSCMFLTTAKKNSGMKMLPNSTPGCRNDSRKARVAKK